MERATWSEKLLAAQSALDTAATLGPGIVSRIREFTVYVVFGAGTSAGAVSVEVSHDKDYTGTWSNVATLAWAAATRVHHTSVTGVHLAIRIRISTAIVGGTVDVHVVAN